MSTPETDPSFAKAGPEPVRGLIPRAAVGGALMGLANLVPGISGGTMLVAAGVYTEFIDAISDVTRFRFRRRSLIVLATVVLAALVAIGGLAGAISFALAEFRWGMYCIFIGLTLGGVPLLWKMTRPLNGAAIAGLLAGAAVMVGLFFAERVGATGGNGAGASMPMLALGGAAGASAMILPGVSGAYLLLLLGLYETIIDAIKDFVSSASNGDVQGVLDQMGVVIPVGVGVVLGVVIVSNILRFVMHRFEKATLGVLLGLLVAAPIGLYPFKEGVEPQVGDTFEGEIVTEESKPEIDPKDWPEDFFTPSVVHIVGGVGLIIAGFGATTLVTRLGSPRKPASTD